MEKQVKTISGLVVRTEKIIIGECFIIPNHPATKQELFWSEETEEEKEKKFKEFMKKWVHSKIAVPMDETYIEVWCVTPGKKGSNWGSGFEMVSPENWDKDLDLEENENLGEQFPKWLPLCLLKDLKEGDVIYLNSKWGLVELHMRQLRYRYRRFGNFEEVLKQIL